MNQQHVTRKARKHPHLRTFAVCLAVMAAITTTVCLRQVPFVSSAQAGIDPRTQTATSTKLPVPSQGSPLPPASSSVDSGQIHAEGALPNGATVFSDQYPGIAKLNSDLLIALRRAANDAGITFSVTSGWRSAAYQNELLQQAIAQYGSAAEAAHWVAPVDKSGHVTGEAVDMGADAAAWLSQYGATYGLCQIYANESWHFELHPAAAVQGCPQMYADPTHDPRLRQLP